MVEKLLSTEQAAEYLGVSKAYLERDRWAAKRAGTPPVIPFVKIGTKVIRYRHAVLEELAVNGS